MSWLLPYLLFAHVIAMVLAFGPTFAYGIYGSLASGDESATGVVNRARDQISRRFVIPGTIVVGITGVLMIVVSGIPILNPAYLWLQVAIVLYVGTIAYDVIVGGRRGKQMGEVGRRLAMQDPDASSPTSDELEMRRLIGAAERDGKAEGLIVIVIIFLMVLKPSLGA